MVQLAGVVALMLVMTCATSLPYWTTAATTKVFLDSAPPETPSQSLSLEAQRGELESGQVSLRTVDMVQVRPVITVGAGWPAEAVLQWSKVLHVWCNASAVYPSEAMWQPDILATPDYFLPSGEVALEGNVTHSFVVTVAVGRGVAPGQYEAMFSLSPLNVSVAVSLTVWNVTLPPLGMRAPTTFSFWYSSDHDGATDLAAYYGGTLDPAVREAYFSLLCDQGVPADNSYVTTTRNWQDVIDVGEHCGAPKFNILDVARAATGVPETNYTEAQIQKVLDMLQPMVANLTKVGLLDQAYVYGFDEISEEYFSGMRQMFGAVKSAYNLTTVSAVRLTPPTDSNLDIWVQLYSLWDDAAAAAWRASGPGRQAWAYHCISPRPDPPGSARRWLNSFLDYPTLDNRLLPWWAAQRQAQGWLYYFVNGWEPLDNHHPVILDPPFQSSTTNFSAVRLNGKAVPGNPHAFTNGDGILIYPGLHGPLLSRRLAALRDGLEDWALLSRLPQSLVANLTADVIFSFVTNQGVNATTDPTVVDTARRRAAAALQ